MQMKILSLGDDFSAGAQHYVAKIAKCDGVEVIAGHLVIEDASLENHFKAIRDSAPVYKFEYNTRSNVRLDTLENCAAARIFDLFEWDYVIIQQRSGLAGLGDTYFPFLTNILPLIRRYCPKAVFALNEPWAFSQQCDDGDFDLYRRDASVMADMIRSSCIDAAKKAGINIILPVGEAWRDFRRAHPEEELTSDGRFGNRLGEFLSAAIWYELLTGNGIDTNSYRLPFVKREQTEMIKAAAHETASKYAIRK